LVIGVDGDGDGDGEERCLGKYVPGIPAVALLGKAEAVVGIEENVPSRVDGDRGEKGRLGRYEYADAVSGRFFYTCQSFSQRDKGDILSDPRRQKVQPYPARLLGLYRSILVRNLVHPSAGH
jgi:hypothetical protein